MKTKILLAAIGLSVSLAVQAAPRTVEFQAVVTEQTGNFGPGVGQTFTGRFTYDTEATPMSTGALRYALDALDLDLGSIGKVKVSAPRYTVWADGVWLEGGGLLHEDVWYEAGGLSVAFATSERGFRLPDTPDDLAKWLLPGSGTLSNGMHIVSGHTVDEGAMSFNVTSVSMVPEVSGWAMSVLGLAGIAAMRMRRRPSLVPHAAPSTTI